MVRGGWMAVVAMVLGVGASGAALGQVTRVATFENFAEGNNWKPTFTDPVTGITFWDSTHPSAGFAIDDTPLLFSGGKYLTAGGYVPGPGASLGIGFGFTADLPAPARRVGFDVTHGEPITYMTVQAFNAAGAVVAEQQGPGGSSADPYHFELVSGGYDIVRFAVSPVPIGLGYDNVSYTVLPEPVGVVSVVTGMGVVLGGRGRRTRNAMGACG